MFDISIGFFFISMGLGGLWLLYTLSDYFAALAKREESYRKLHEVEQRLYVERARSALKTEFNIDL